MSGGERRQIAEAFLRLPAEAADKVVAGAGRNRRKRQLRMARQRLCGLPEGAVSAADIENGGNPVFGGTARQRLGMSGARGDLDFKRFSAHRKNRANLFGKHGCPVVFSGGRVN